MEIKSRNYSLKRFMNRFLKIFIDSRLISSTTRAKLYSIIGVKIIDINSCFIGRDVSIDDIHPELLTVGSNTIIASGTKILTHYLDTSKPIHTFVTGEVIIGNNVFIGANVIISKALYIGNGSVIAAGSIVTKDVEEFSIVAGVPAKKIGTRNKQVRKD